MGIFDGVNEDEGYDRAQRRVKKLSVPELITWLEVAIPGMQRQLETYQRTGDKAYLAELGIAEMTTSLVVSELIDRANKED
jgi:hypothetical protein